MGKIRLTGKNKGDNAMRIGIDMGGMSFKLGLVDDDNRIVARHVIPTELDIPYQDMIKKTAQAVRDLTEKAGVALEECTGIGVGTPGMLDDTGRVILYSNNFGWENVPFAEEMEKLLPLPISMANDADAAALGEVCAGAAQRARSAVLLTLGTGVGGGVIIDGHIFHGPVRGGCEIGHMVIAAGGETCTCGRSGCMEAYCSASALIRMATEEMEKSPESALRKLCDEAGGKMNGKIPFDAAQMGDEAGRRVIDEYESYLACGIANVINIFRPEKVILGGGVAAQRDNLTVPLTEMVKNMCFGNPYGEVADIVVSVLGNDAGIIGAANLV